MCVTSILAFVLYYKLHLRRFGSNIKGNVLHNSAVLRNIICCYVVNSNKVVDLVNVSFY